MWKSDAPIYGYLPVVDAGVAQQIPALLERYGDGLAPSTDDQIERMITKIALLYPGGKLSDAESAARLELYIDLLRDIPFDILSSAFRSVAQKSRFFPTVAEIRDAAAPALRARRGKLVTLQMLLDKHERYWSPPVAPEDLATPEDIARIKREVAEEFRAKRSMASAR